MSLPGFDLMGLVAHDAVLAKLSESVKVVTAFPCPLCAKKLREHVVDKLSLFWCPCGYAGSVMDMFLYPMRGKHAESMRRLRAVAPSSVADEVLETCVKQSWERLDMQARIALGRSRIDHGALAPWVVASLQNLGVYPVRQRDARGRLLFLPLLAETPSTVRELEGDQHAGVDMLDFVPVGSPVEVIDRARKRFSLIIPAYMAPSLPCGFHTWDLKGNDLGFEDWTAMDLAKTAGLGGYFGEKWKTAVVTNVAPAFVTLHQRWSAGRDDACPLLFATEPCATGWATDDAVIWFPESIQAALRMASRCEGRVSTWHPGWAPAGYAKNKKQEYWQGVTSVLSSFPVQQVLAKVRGSAVPWRVAASAYLRESPAAASEFLRSLALPAGVLAEITGKAEDHVDGAVFFVGSRAYREKPSGLYEVVDGKEELLCSARVCFKTAVHYDNSVYLLGSVSVGTQRVEFCDPMCNVLESFPSWLQTLCAKAGLPIPYVRVGRTRAISGVGDILLARYKPSSIRGYDFPRREDDVFVLDGFTVQDGEIKESEILYRRKDVPVLDFSPPGFEHGVPGWYVVALCAAALMGHTQQLFLCGGSVNKTGLTSMRPFENPEDRCWPAFAAEDEEACPNFRRRVRRTAQAGKISSVIATCPLLALCLSTENKFAIDATGWDGRVSWYRLAQLLAFGQADGFRHGTDFLAFLALAREMGVPLPPPLSLAQLACLVDGPGFSLDNLTRKAKVAHLVVPTAALLADAAKTMKRDGKLWH